MPILLDDWELLDPDAPLGRGGYATVFRGRHPRLGLPVAIKVLTNPIWRTPAGALAFERELATVGRLSHPGIARPLDHGRITEPIADLAPGAPFLVMELARALPLARRPGPWTWPEIRAALVGLLDALAHAHARGVVHADVSPNNVLVDPDGRVRLVDFGLATPVELLDSAESRAIAGTPRYMAPEQRAGRWREIGPWTDLWSVGAIAWALTTGSPPATMPPPPFPDDAPAPPGFGAWAERLLAPAPAHRFRFAADAARALVALGEADGVAAGDFALTATCTIELDVEPIDAPSAPGAPLPLPPVPADWRSGLDRSAAVERAEVLGRRRALVGRAELPLVGREAERDALWALLVALRADPKPTAALIRGAAGVGKSRLARWLAERAHELGVAEIALVTHGPDPSPGDGLAGLLARVEPEAPAAEAVARVDAWIRRVTASRPIVLWIDDAPYGIEALELAARLLARPDPVLVLMTARDDALLDRPWAEEIVHRLARHTTTLGPLSYDDHARLVRQVLALEPSFADEVARRTAGNPLHAIQLVESLLERDDLQPTPLGYAPRPGVTLELPALSSVYAERLRLALGDGLPLAAVAAVLGDEVALDEWREVAASVGQPWSDAVPDALLRLGFAALDRGTTHLRFTHGLVREALLGALDPAPVHAVCASVLRERAGERIADDASAQERVGRHLLGAGDREAAWDLLFRAAGIHSVNGRYRACLGLLGACDHALEAAASDDPRRGHTERLRCESLLLFGRVEEARDRLFEALPTAEAHGWPARAGLRRLLGQAYVHLGHADEAMRHLAAAIVASVEVGDAVGAAICHVSFGNVAQSRCRFADAIREYAAAAEGFTALGRPDQVASARIGHACCLMYAGDLTEARRVLDAAASLVGDSLWMRAYVTLVRAAVETAAMDFVAADREVSLAMRLFDQIGTPAHLAITRRVRAELSFWRGTTDGLDAELADLVALLASDGEEAGDALAVRALWQLVAGAPELARESAIAAVGQGGPRQELQGRYAVAAVAAALGDASAYDRAMEAAERLHAEVPAYVPVLGFLAELAMEAWEADPARAARSERVAVAVWERLDLQDRRSELQGRVRRRRDTA